MAPGIHERHPNRLHNNNVQVVFQTAKLGDVNKLKTLLENRGVNINHRDCSGRTALMWAVENDFPTAVETLIEAGADVNETRSINKHLTPVMTAAEKGYTKILQLLTASGAYVNDHRYDKETPLTIALHNGQLTCVDILIDAGADCNYLSPGGTPVMLAVRNNRDCLQTLIDNGADVNTPDTGNNTPLTLAVDKGHLGFVTSLIKAGADCNYLSPGGTPVMLAVRNNRDCFQALIDNGADVNTPDTGNNTPLTLAVDKGHLGFVTSLIKAGADWNYRSPIGTPFMIAIKNNNNDILQALVDNGADVNTSDRWGNTPLTFAIQKDYLASVKTLISCGADLNLRSPKGPPLYTAYSLGKLEVAELLLQGGADVDIANSSGHTLLMLAAIRHGEKWVQTLIQAGADANLVSSTGRTALILAIRHRHTVDESTALYGFSRETRASTNAKKKECETKHCDIFKCYHMHANCCPYLISSRFSLAEINYCKLCYFLLEHSTSVNIQDNNGKTALMYCVETNDRHFAKLLLDNKADPNIRDANEETALMNCFEINQLYFDEFLFYNKGSPNIRDSNGKTAVMGCVKTNHRLFAEFLSDNKADPNIQDNDGKTALMYSVLNNRRNFAELLLDNSADPNVQDTEGKTALMHSLDNDCFDILLSKNVDTDRSDKTHATALVYFLRILVDSSVYKEDIMRRLCKLLRCGANPMIYQSHRYLLNQLYCKICSENLMYCYDHYEWVHAELIRIFVCNGMGSPGKKTLPMTAHCCIFVFDKRYRSFVRFAYYLDSPGIMRYLIATCFLTNTDLTLLRELQWLHPWFKMTGVLYEVLRQPWPLVKLSFIAVSTAVGFDCDRQERIRETQLPPRLQRMLMFQEPVSRLPVSEWHNISLCFNPVAYEQLPKPRPTGHLAETFFVDAFYFHPSELCHQQVVCCSHLRPPTVIPGMACKSLIVNPLYKLNKSRDSTHPCRMFNAFKKFSIDFHLL